MQAVLGAQHKATGAGVVRRELDQRPIAIRQVWGHEGEAAV